MNHARKILPVYRMTIIDVINECTDRLTMLERLKPIRKGDTRTTTVFGVTYAVHQFVYSAATPTREEHVEVILIDLEHGDIRSLAVQDTFDPIDGFSSFAHDFLVELRLLCKAWRVCEWSQQ